MVKIIRLDDINELLNYLAARGFILNKGYEATMPNREFDDFLIQINFACMPDERAKSFLHDYQSALEKDGLPIQISYEIVTPLKT